MNILLPLSINNAIALRRYIIDLYQYVLLSNGYYITSIVWFDTIDIHLGVLSTVEVEENPVLFMIANEASFTTDGVNKYRKHTSTIDNARTLH